MTFMRVYPSADAYRNAYLWRNMINSFFGNDENLGRNGEHDGLWQPRTNILETRDAFEIVMELPGMRGENVSVCYEDGVLRVEGERKTDETHDGFNLIRRERIGGKFLRTFAIDTRIQEDLISADLRDGLLRISLPKAEEVKPKEVKIKVSK